MLCNFARRAPRRACSECSSAGSQDGQVKAFCFGEEEEGSSDTLCDTFATLWHMWDPLASQAAEAKIPDDDEDEDEDEVPAQSPVEPMLSPRWAHAGPMLFQSMQPSLGCSWRRLNG